MRILIYLLLICVGFDLAAQDSGTIIYKLTRKMEDAPNDEDQKRFASLMAGANVSKKQLDYTKSESIFFDVTGERTSESSDIDASGGERKMVIKIAKNEEQFYKNFDNKTTINKQDLFGKVFLIKENFIDKKWKITQEQKNINNLACIKATALNSKGNNVIAWFAPAIPVFNGPEGWDGLPGLIIELNENDGEFIYEVEEIRAVKNLNIVPPSEGDKISWKKFLELEEKKLKEMKEMYGGNGRMIMIKTEERN